MITINNITIPTLKSKSRNGRKQKEPTKREKERGK